MNENIDLTKILKDCPKRTKLYTPLAGEVYFVGIKERDEYQIDVENEESNGLSFNKQGRYFTEFGDGECLLFPDKENRDWSKFKAPWYKKEKFDPKTLKPFDKVIARCLNNEIWRISYFSHFANYEDGTYYSCINNFKFIAVIPYNEDTKHLLGTIDDAPEYYRYWED